MSLAVEFVLLLFDGLKIRWTVSIDRSYV